jgi:hypothetical protein
MIGAAMMLTGAWQGEGVFNIEQLDPDPFMDMLKPGEGSIGTAGGRCKELAGAVVKPMANIARGAIPMLGSVARTAVSAKASAWSKSSLSRRQRASHLQANVSRSILIRAVLAKL